MKKTFAIILALLTFFVFTIAVSASAPAETNAPENTINDPGVGIVILLGIGIVFIGLIVIIFMCKLLGWAVGSKSDADAPVQDLKPSVQTTMQTIQNKGEVVAAVSAAVAESLGTDVSAIRIKSIKRI